MRKIALVFIVAALTLMRAAAREVEVKDFAADAFDLTAQKYAPNDLNGRKCALVKVQVLSPGVVFSGNVIGTPERHSSEYWVYMTHGTKMLKLASESFLPLMFGLENYTAIGACISAALLAETVLCWFVVCRKKRTE